MTSKRTPAKQARPAGEFHVGGDILLIYKVDRSVDILPALKDGDSSCERLMPEPGP